MKSFMCKDFINITRQWVSVFNVTLILQCAERTTVLVITGYLSMRIRAQSTTFSRRSSDGVR